MMKRCFLASMPEGSWWVDNGGDIWTGPFATEEESREYAHFMHGSYDCGSNRSYGRSTLPDPRSASERIERELKMILADLNRIIDELKTLEDPPAPIMEEVDMIVARVNDLK